MHECFVWLSLSSERFIEVFVPCQKSKQSGHVYVIGVSSVPLTFFLLDFELYLVPYQESERSGHIYM